MVLKPHTTVTVYRRCRVVQYHPRAKHRKRRKKQRRRRQTNASCILPASIMRPNSTFSCTVPEIITARCGAYPVCAGVTDSMTLPLFGASSPNSPWINVVFPEPTEPTMAVSCPRGTATDTSFSTSGNPTSSAPRPPTGLPPAAPSTVIVVALVTSAGA